MQLECQKYPDSVMQERRLMVQPCFFVGNLMTEAKAFISLQKKSILRLGLVRCLVLTRLYRICREALEFAEISSYKKVFWMDSKVVLS